MEKQVGGYKRLRWGLEQLTSMMNYLNLKRDHLEECYRKRDPEALSEAIKDMIKALKVIRKDDIKDIIGYLKDTLY